MKNSILCPFPHKDLTKGVPSDGLVFSAPKYCVKYFERKGCQKFYDSISATKHLKFQKCPQGFLVASFKLNEKRFSVCGMIDVEDKNDIDRSLRKENKRNWIDRQKITGWHESIVEQENLKEKEFSHLLRKNLQPFHDIKVLVGAISDHAISLAQTLSPGKTINESLEGASSYPELLSIYKSASLIDLLGKMQDFLANPDLINAGRKSRRGVYKSFDKIARILQFKASENRVEVRLVNNNYDEIDAYDCFDLLPLVLIDNGIKYSFINQNLEIKFQKSRDELEVEVSNYGPAVDDLEEEEIFGLFRRGIYATKTTQGAGIGLYLAKKIVEIHGGNIFFESKKDGTEFNSVFCAKNKVIIRLPL